MLNIGHKVDYDDHGLGLLTGKDFNLIVDNINKVIEETGDEQTYDMNDQLAKAIDIFVKRNIYKNIGTVNNLTLIKHSSDSIGSLESYTEGMSFFFTVNEDNTDAVKIKINNLEEKDVTLYNGSALQPGDLSTGSAYFCSYDGSKFIMYLYNNSITYTGNVDDAANTSGDFDKTFEVGTGISNNEAVRLGDLDNTIANVLENKIKSISFKSDDGSYAIKCNSRTLSLNRLSNGQVVNELSIGLKDSNVSFIEELIFKEDGLYLSNNKILSTVDDVFTKVYPESGRTFKPGEYSVDNIGTLSIYLDTVKGKFFFRIGSDKAPGYRYIDEDPIIENQTSLIPIQKFYTYMRRTSGITNDGNVYSTGQGEHGSLGLGDTNDRHSFTDTGKTAKSIYVNSMSCMIIGLDDKVWATGYNNKGELGLGDTNDRTSFVDTGKTAKYISHQNGSTYLIDLNNRVWVTGNNHYGQLGLGDTNDRTSFTNTGKTAKYIITKNQTTFLVDLTDKLYVVGLNRDGQLGLGDTSNRNVFIDTGIFVKDAIPDHTSIILNHNDEVWVTGRNSEGQLGLGDTNGRTSFVNTGKTAKSIFNGFWACMIIGLDDRVWGTGYNDKGRLGLGDTNDRDTFTYTGATARTLNMGNLSTLLLSKGGKVWATGENNRGQLGLGDTNDRNIFTPTGKIAAKIYSDGFYSFIEDLNGVISGSGRNEYGQLGVGDTTDRLVFTESNLTL